MPGLREALTEAYEVVEDTPEGSERPSGLVPIIDDTTVNDLPTHSAGGETEGENTDPVVKEESKAKPVERKSSREAASTNVDGKIGEKEVKAATPAVKAPQSWKPALREQFNKIPPEIQSEILRRETEISRALTESANSRKFHNDFAQVIRPFEALIAGSNIHPLQAVRNLMTTAATLQTGTQAQRANTVANIIKAYGVDIATLDAVLAGKQIPKQNSQVDDVMRRVEERLAPITQQMTQQQREQQRRQQEMERAAGQSIEQFGADPKNEYFEDLREEMADMLELSAQRGRLMTIQEAYDRAAALHPEISKLVAKKQTAEKIAQSKGNINRARRAAVSQGNGVPGSVGSSGKSNPKGLRNALTQAFDDLSA